MRKRAGISYIVELAITLLLILFVSVVLIKVFAWSKSRTEYASQLTDAVKLSENIAELASGTGEKETLVETLKTLDQVSSVNEEGGNIVVNVPSYQVVLNWRENDMQQEGMIYNEIRVYDADGNKEIYCLDTGFPEREKE